MVADIYVDRGRGHAFRADPQPLIVKYALFAGSDDGGDHWAAIASMIETCKLSGINPQTRFADTLTRLVAGHTATALDQLMPRNHITAVT